MIKDVCVHVCGLFSCALPHSLTAVNISLTEQKRSWKKQWSTHFTTFLHEGKKANVNSNTGVQPCLTHWLIMCNKDDTNIYTSWKSKRPSQRSLKRKSRLIQTLLLYNIWCEMCVKSCPEEQILPYITRCVPHRLRRNALLIGKWTNMWDPTTSGL